MYGGLFLISMSVTTDVRKINGEPNSTKIPSKTQIINFENHRMAVRATQDCELKFGKNWNADKCSSWLRELLPAPFAFNDKRSNGDPKKSPLTLLSREEKRLTVVAIRRAPNGQDLADFKSRAKAGVKDSKIIFSSPICQFAYLVLPDHSVPAFKKQIKPQVYEAWENRDSDSEAQHSDSDARRSNASDEDEDDEQRSSDIKPVEQHKPRRAVEETPAPARKRVAKFEGSVHKTFRLQ
jgi:hypothetical protein